MSIAYRQVAAPRWEELVSCETRVHERNQQVALHERRGGTSANVSFTFWLVLTVFRLFVPADDFDNVFIFEKHIKKILKPPGGGGTERVVLSPSEWLNARAAAGAQDFSYC